jgi:3-methylcrotonyl-CoA carboxylase alpha subunit
VSEQETPLPSIEALGHNRFSVPGREGHHVGYAVAEGRKTWVWLNGHAYVLSDDAPNEDAARVRTDEMALMAPMPATVRSVPISPGQRVSAGDVLIVLEAMKMELAIKAPGDGTVRAVHCAPGEIVQPGIALVEME